MRLVHLLDLIHGINEESCLVMGSICVVREAKNLPAIDHGHVRVGLMKVFLYFEPLTYHLLDAKLPSLATRQGNTASCGFIIYRLIHLTISCYCLSVQQLRLSRLVGLRGRSIARTALILPTCIIYL